ncbi:hypothetical protein AR457_20275 [Streptomyces agglomeratus]|uniref:DUF6082 family protein n=1 Tax=Streptomyces agglomeratus TaxID=285458 RepID=UPI00086A83A1|nr:DUF6082 family protein [Streptomyces agglomeratus]OEJ39498.1 hypothetical protein BGK70_16375 [Streptomyces agglomeratus]OEJ46118.1 hypothetical protein AR457_20275 [Streptomyces agglomeratus]
MNQAISVISLAISTAALVIIAISLSYQSRQTRMSQDENMRAHHRELVHMSMNDPSLRPCWGEGAPSGSEERQRQLLFSNLIFSWYYSAYMTRDVNDAQLKVNLDTFFRGEIGRAYWSAARSGWADLTNAVEAKRKKNFLAVADSCYESAGARTS